MKYGVAGICVLLCLHFLLKVFEIFTKQKAQKEQVSEETLRTTAIRCRNLSRQVKALNAELAKNDVTLKKFNIDLRRAYAAMKLLAGEQWTEISEKIRKDIHI